MKTKARVNQSWIEVEIPNAWISLAMLTAVALLGMVACVAKGVADDESADPVATAHLFRSPPRVPAGMMLVHVEGGPHDFAARSAYRHPLLGMCFVEAADSVEDGQEPVTFCTRRGYTVAASTDLRGAVREEGEADAQQAEESP